MPVELSDGRAVMTLDEIEDFVSAVLALAEATAWPEWQTERARNLLRSGALLALKVAEERRAFTIRKIASR